MSISSSTSILSLSKKPTKSMEALAAAGFRNIEDLLWLFPLRVEKIPPIKPFSKIAKDCYFQGFGSISSVQSRPNFKIKGKGKAPLTNISIFVKDYFSTSIIEIKWFNTYPSFEKKIREIEYITFLGQTQEYNGKIQFINPEFSKIENDNVSSFIEHATIDNNLLKIQYPTVNSVSSANVKKVFAKIPDSIWDNIPETINEEIKKKNNFPDIGSCFKLLHGRIQESQSLTKSMAIRRLAYEEFFRLSLKVLARRKNQHSIKTQPLNLDSNSFLKNEELFPYHFTGDQKKSINEIISDFNSDFPMMRLIQGDVGCGKTSVAVMAALACTTKGFQVAIMCPTEALALQHSITFSEILKNTGLRIGFLVGSTKQKDRISIYRDLEDGKIDIMIGTHSLIQNNVKFKNLKLAIIDEQHKFGVNQRLELIKKGENPHCLIMTATPIPRSLSLTQYGDLDISIIKEMPPGRKGTKTRIVTKQNFPQFLSFVKTRIEMGEQVYVVVPAIEESEEQDILALETVLKKFQAFFPDLNIEGLHGQLKAEEKEKGLKDFFEGKYNILVSTSVIEVGINIPNASIMAIMNPDRFGLSSLHQLRGRVGRGSKPGFCFLVNDRPISVKSMQRLQVIEGTTDGFIIAEEDLKMRGQGNLFGTEQSGAHAGTRVANIFEHLDLLELARSDCQKLIDDKNPKILEVIQQFSEDHHVIKTI